MKVAFPTESDSIKSRIDARFGRSNYFVIVDSNTEKPIKSIANPAANVAGGAGIEAAQTLLNEKIEAVIAPNIGPNAFKVLKAANIAMYEPLTDKIIENLRFLKEGKLPAQSGPRRGMGHRGRRR